jgi:hypothetical protein
VEIHIGVLKDVLNIPMSALRRQGAVHYVWKVSPSGPEAIPVKVGGNNLTHVVITEGLQVRDRIHLARPEGANTPEFEQPAARVHEVLIPGGTIPTSGEARQAEARGSTNPMAAGGMQALGKVRDFLKGALPQYREQLADDTGWFRLFQDAAFQQAMGTALESAPAELRDQLQGLQQSMSRGRGGRGTGRRGGH